MTGTAIASFALGPVPVAVAMLCLCPLREKTINRQDTAGSTTLAVLARPVASVSKHVIAIAKPLSFTGKEIVEWQRIQ